MRSASTARRPSLPAAGRSGPSRSCRRRPSRPPCRGSPSASASSSRGVTPKRAHRAQHAQRDRDREQRRDEPDQTQVDGDREVAVVERPDARLARRFQCRVAGRARAEQRSFADLFDRVAVAELAMGDRLGGRDLRAELPFDDGVQRPVPAIRAARMTTTAAITAASARRFPALACRAIADAPASPPPPPTSCAIR